MNKEHRPATLTLPAAASSSTEPVAREDFDQMSGNLTRAKNLLVRLYDQIGRDPSPEKLRGMIEHATGTWFVWGQDRDAPVPAAEAVPPASCAPAELVVMRNGKELTDQKRGRREFYERAMESAPHKEEPAANSAPMDACVKGWLAALSDALYAAKGNAWLVAKLEEILVHLASPAASHTEESAGGEAPAEEADAATLLRKYKKLCVEIRRGDDYHLARIDRAIESLAPHTEEPAGGLQHVAVAEEGVLRWMSGRKLQNCELYAMPDSQAPAVPARLSDACIVQEIEYARDHGWPFECRGRLEAMAEASKRRAALAASSAPPESQDAADAQKGAAS